MPLRKTSIYKYLEPDYRYKEKYWPILTDFVKKKYGDSEITSLVAVQETLKECFSILCKEFVVVLKKEKRASFFVFVQDLHEDSIEIWRAQLNGEKFPINQENFAASRRIMKYILEQGCSLDLIGHDSFFKEISEQIEPYTEHLEELVYIGTWAFTISEYIARSQICNHSVSLKVENNEFVINVDPPFNSLFSFIFADNQRHSKFVVVSDSIIELKKILNDDLKINYDYLCGAIFGQLQDKKFRFSIFKLDELIKELIKKHGYSKDVLEIFYSGLMVNKNNVLSIEDCILKTQDSRRYMYRPILEYTIDQKTFWIIGANKWSESLTTLTTNCIPFGQFPDEWKQLIPIYDFCNRVMNTHDVVLEEPAIEIIKNVNLKFDRNIKTLKKTDNQGLSIIKKNIGEIDVVFIDEKDKLIYVAECKHNKSRFEYNNWKRDISNFRSKYESQLSNKFNWISNNKLPLLEHFEILYTCKIESQENYNVIPLFIINAPTLYMYDSEYLVVTLHDLELLLNGKHVTHEFNGEINGKKVNIKKPYLQNAEKLFI